MWIAAALHGCGRPHGCGTAARPWVVGPTRPSLRAQPIATNFSYDALLEPQPDAAADNEFWGTYFRTGISGSRPALQRVGTSPAFLDEAIPSAAAQFELFPQRVTLFSGRSGLAISSRAMRPTFRRAALEILSLPSPYDVAFESDALPCERADRFGAELPEPAIPSWETAVALLAW